MKIETYRPWAVGNKPIPRQLVSDSRRRYARKKRLTGRGRNVVYGIIAVCVVAGITALSRCLHVAAQVVRFAAQVVR